MSATTGRSTLLLDRTAWDLCLDSNGSIAVAKPPYAQVQDAASCCRMFLGDAWYATRLGIPYLQQILGKQPSPRLVKSYLEAAAQRVPGVTSAKVFLTSITDRTVSGQVQVTLSTGEVQSIPF